MKRKPKLVRVRGTIALPSEVKWNDLEFENDIAAINRERAEAARIARQQAKLARAAERKRLEEQAKADRAALKRFKEQGRIIAADLERERRQLLTEALQKRAEYLIDIKLTEMKEAIEADRDDARKVFGAYVEKVAKAFHLAVENEAKEREIGQKALKRIEATMQKERLHDERLLLMRRGVVKGRRR